MKRTTLIALFAIATMAFSSFSTPCLAQKKNKPQTEETDAKDLISLSEEPEFPGGIYAMMKFLRSEIKYPKECAKNNISGRALVQFVISEKGKITKVKIAKSSGNKLLDKEAVRVIKRMPKWKPGKKIDGKAVRVKYAIPINFRL